MAGRFHTCYSPVRRSPAGAGKPAPPLPLDLHVLSLSLAFILSQDQTLRCCYLVFLSFQKEMFAARPGGRRGDSGQEVSGTRPGCYLCKVLCRIDGVFMRAASPRLTPVFLYYFVLVIAKLSMCSRFRVAGNPFGKPRRKSSAKLRRIFRTGKFFRNFFFEPPNRDPAPGVTSPRGGARPPPRRPLRFRKRVQRYALPTYPPNFYAIFFEEIYKKTTGFIVKSRVITGISIA